MHLSVQLLAFAAALTDAAEDADTLVCTWMHTNHVVDHLGQQHGFADSGPTEQPSLATSFQWHQHINHLDAGLEDHRRGRAVDQRGRRTVH